MPGVCVQSSIEEDPHRTNPVDHRKHGHPMVVLDYKELRKDRAPHLVMREAGSGATYGLRCAQKGGGDPWIVERLTSKLDAWGLRDCTLWVKSDCEPAVRALQGSIKAARDHCTLLPNPPPHDPQGNGVAESYEAACCGPERH